MMPEIKPRWYVVAAAILIVLAAFIFGGWKALLVAGGLIVFALVALVVFVLANTRFI